MRSCLAFTLAALLSLTSHAQAPKPAQDHTAHHPDGASAPASAPRKAPARAAARAKAAAPASAPASGMAAPGAGMRGMHDEMHKPGGMHEAKHGKDGPMPRGPMAGMPPAPPASPASR